MNGLAFPINCTCGGGVLLLAAGVGQGAETRAVVQCEDCGSDLLVRVHLEVVTRRVRKRPRLEVVA